MNDLTRIENTLIQGDLSKLTTEERTKYYLRVCETLGLNPLTKPFEYIRLSGKETLYATRNCTEQLRKVHGVSLQIVARETIGDVYVVTARARLGDRDDESTGAVPIKGLYGDNLANAYMKAETKAKRRVTLSICGLGLLDESEVETVHAKEKLNLTTSVQAAPKPSLPVARVTETKTETVTPEVEHNPEVVAKVNQMVQQLKKLDAEEVVTSDDTGSYAMPMAESTDSIWYRQQQEKNKGKLATDKQKGLIRRLANELGWDNQTASDWLKESFGVATTDQLTSRQASGVIDALKEQTESAKIPNVKSDAEFLREIENL